MSHKRNDPEQALIKIYERLIYDKGLRVMAMERLEQIRQMIDAAQISIEAKLRAYDKLQAAIGKGGRI